MKSRKTLCICDDDTVFTFLTRHTISSTGLNFDITEFENGSILLNFVKEELANRRELPDLIFLDLNMPVMGGWEFLDELERADIAESLLPDIYIYSSSSFQGDIAKAAGYRVVKGFITKPLTQDTILDTSKKLK